MLTFDKKFLKFAQYSFFLNASKQNENLRNFKVTSVSAFLFFVFVGFSSIRSTTHFIFRFYDFFPNGQLQISGLSLRRIAFLLSMDPKTLDIASFNTVDFYPGVNLIFQTFKMTFNRNVSLVSSFCQHPPSPASFPSFRLACHSPS